MNLILLDPPQAVAGNRYRLCPRQAHHVDTVLAARPGDTLRCGLLNGKRGSGVLHHVGEHRELDVCLDEPPPPALPLTLVLALPRPKMLKRMLIDAASLGIKKIVLLNSWKVDKSYWQTPELKAGLLAEKLRLGLEQAGDTLMPTLTLAKRFRPFVEDDLKAITGNSQCVLADPSGETYMPCDLDTPVTLAVGPEGGWTTYERDMLLAHGFTCYRLGERILRSETALPALTGRLMRLP
ncbi:MAG: 16S rRNA (uracil(1498)-N(3))-methyltransferase [Alcanivoracaceae bacterium]|nr:16S rRNA (uracil(1498)-N(3))-methyltransferase [Alcanivoracaceae bacterium]